MTLLFRDETVGFDARPTFAPGLVAKAVVMCSAVGSLLGHELTVSGFFAPESADAQLPARACQAPFVNMAPQV